MDLRTVGLNPTVLSILEDMLDFSEEPEKEKEKEKEKGKSNPSRAYVRDAKAMAKTPADVAEYPNCYVFVVDMPGIKATEIKVQVENDNVLVVSGERKRDKENSDNKESGVKYLSMERRVGKFMRKFTLPDNADLDKISAVSQDGVLTVTVEKIPPPQPKKPKTIEVKAN